MKLEARLRAFTAFVRRRSFSGAAHELRISQPAISRHVADLERELGCMLVNRRSGKLTAAGDLLGLRMDGHHPTTVKRPNVRLTMLVQR